MQVVALCGSLKRVDADVQLRGVELGAELCQAESHAPLDGPWWEGEALGDLLVGQAVEEAQLDHLQLCRRQPHEQMRQLLLLGARSEVAGQVLGAGLPLKPPVPPSRRAATARRRARWIARWRTMLIAHATTARPEQSRAAKLELCYFQ